MIGAYMGTTGGILLPTEGFMVQSFLACWVFSIWVAVAVLRG